VIHLAFIGQIVRMCPIKCNRGHRQMLSHTGAGMGM